MKVLISGATGLIGNEIVKQCHKKGYAVHYLTTDKNKIQNNTNYQGFYWNPAKGEIDRQCFSGVTGVINLAGSTITKRWTAAYKNKIIESRVQSLELLNKTIKKLPSHSIQSFISASGIGIYPNSLINYYEIDEKKIDSSFIGEVTKKWENGIHQLTSHDFPVATIRIGLVLSNKGGALTEMVKPIKYNLGAPFGSGEQWQSWIHIKDMASMFLFVLDNKLAGVFNGVAPNPVTNNKLTKEIAAVLKRSLFLPNIPKPVMNILMGEMAYILFSSQRVNCKRILNLGFQFQYLNIKNALENLLHKKA